MEEKEVEKETKYSAVSEREGKYIYCIIDESEQGKFGTIGIGGRGDEVYTVNYKDLACVVSNTAELKYSITRENTIQHQKAIEKVMETHTVLPVKFCTIANDEDPNVDLEERIREKVLKARYDEFMDLLNRMSDKAEMGLKVLWKDMDSVFKEIVHENEEIRRLKNLLVKTSPEKTHYDRIRLGEMVKKTLEDKKSKESEMILDPLRRLSADSKTNKLFGDKMILNASFLVPKPNQQGFDREINKLEEKLGERMTFKYVGPTPPYNFVEIVIHW